VEISLSTILAPADTLIQLLFVPRLIYFCAVFAYDGFKNNVTLTHGGMRKGNIAKIYAVFYSLFILFSVATIPLYGTELLIAGEDKLKQALLIAFPNPIAGFVFVGLSLFAFLFKEGIVKFSKEKIQKNEFGQKMFNSMLLFLLAIGIQSFLGFPYWVYISIMTYFMYFGAFTSPAIIKKAMPAPVEKQSRKGKNMLKEPGAL